jgi:hypothetical protein
MLLFFKEHSGMINNVQTWNTAKNLKARFIIVAVGSAYSTVFVVFSHIFTVQHCNTCERKSWRIFLHIRNSAMKEKNSERGT